MAEIALWAALQGLQASFVELLEYYIFYPKRCMGDLLLTLSAVFVAISYRDLFDAISTKPLEEASASFPKHLSIALLLVAAHCIFSRVELTDNRSSTATMMLAAIAIGITSVVNIFSPLLE